MVPTRHRTSSLPQALRAEDLATNWPDELLARCITGASEQATQCCGGTFGRDCCCHVTYSTPKMCRCRLQPARKISCFATRRSRHEYTESPVLVSGARTDRAFVVGVTPPRRSRAV